MYDLRMEFGELNELVAELMEAMSTQDERMQAFIDAVSAVAVRVERHAVGQLAEVERLKTIVAGITPKGAFTD